MCEQVIIFHEFFSEEETDAFIRHGRGRYSKSLAAGIDEERARREMGASVSSRSMCEQASERTAPLATSKPRSAARSTAGGRDLIEIRPRFGRDLAEISADI